VGITSDDIYREIAAECFGMEWACLGELANATASGSNYLDAWRVNLWPSKAIFQTFEIKVNRSDFLSEIKNPDKRKFGLSVSNEFYFATCASVIKDVCEVPEECGWILYWYEGEKDGFPILRKEVKKKAPYREMPERASWGFVRSIARRVNSNMTQVYEKEIKDKLKDITYKLYDGGRRKGYDRLFDLSQSLVEEGHIDIARRICECFKKEEYGIFDIILKRIDGAEAEIHEEAL